MDSQYQHFGLSDNGSIHGELRRPPQTGPRRMVSYVLYGVVLLLLLVLLMVTGISLSRLGRDMNEVKVHLQMMNQGGRASLLSAGSEGSCREGWVSFQSSCYLLSASLSSWSAAEETCQQFRAHLLVVNSQDEQDYISNSVEFGSRFWIGLVERHQEGNWTWVDGTDYNLTPKFWALNQPDNWALIKNGEDCGEIYNDHSVGQKIWNDADCRLKLHYICES